MSFIRLVVLLGLAAAAVAGGWWWRQGPVVTVAAVTRGDAAEVIYATGVVEPLIWAKVSPLLRARITEHCRCEGRMVRQGDVLARLDDEAPRAQLREAHAKRDYLMAEVARQMTLVERGTVSRTTLERLESELRQTEAVVAALSARLTDYVLLAPAEGVVLRADGNVGDIVAAGEVLFWVGRPTPLRLVSEVNEEDIPRVKEGQQVLLRHDGFPPGTLTATVAEITPKGDPVAKTFRVYMALPPDTPLRIGMSVEANIVAREKKDVLLAPAEALHEGALFTVEEGRLKRVAVETGIRGTRMVEIVSGAPQGLAVVSPWKTAFRDGMRVRRPAPEPAP
jgi:RND family efflux transporter MFP subunit